MKKGSFSCLYINDFISFSDAIQTCFPGDSDLSKVLWADLMLGYEDYRKFGFNSSSDLMFIEYLITKNK